MTIDVEIEKAIEEAVREAGQSPPLARKIIAWVDAVAAGNEDVNDPQSAERHLDLLYQATEVEISTDAESPRFE